MSHDECFICFEDLHHGVLFGCNHQVCIHCFMKLEMNLCPFCRFPIHKVEHIHNSHHIPPFLQKICKNDDIFSFVLLQIIHSSPELFKYKTLVREIYSWQISHDIKILYIQEIRTLFQYIHPEKNQILILLLHLTALSWFLNDKILILESNDNIHRTLVFFPITILINIIMLGYSIYILCAYRQIRDYKFSNRNKIQLENLMV